MGRIFKSEGVSLSGLLTFRRRYGTGALLRFLRSEYTHEPFHIPVSHNGSTTRFYSNWDRGAFYHLMVSWKKIEKLVEAVSEFENPIILDVGANLGVFSLLAAQRLRNAEIHAFEPSRIAFPLLQRNVGDLAKLNQVAVGSAEGSIRFHEALDQVQSSTTKEHAIISDQTRSYDVPSLRLDAYLDHLGPASRPVIVKIDVQGAERDVVEGLGQWRDKVSAYLLESSWLDADSVRIALDMVQSGWNSRAINLVGGGADLLLTPTSPPESKPAR